MTTLAALAIDGGRPLRDRFLPYHQPLLGPEEEASVIETLRSGWITTGPRTKAFESALAAYVGAPHAVALNSCTAALHLALEAAGVGVGDEVVTTPITFASTANVVVHRGATPVFADVRAGHGQHRPGRARGGDDGPDQGGDSGSPGRPAVRHAGHCRGGGAPRPHRNRRRGSCDRRRIRRPARRRPWPDRLLFRFTPPRTSRAARAAR